jgi:hypothetical protein
MYLCISINESDINWGIYKHTITSQSENHIYYRILDNGTGYYYYVPHNDDGDQQRRIDSKNSIILSIKIATEKF